MPINSFLYPGAKVTPAYEVANSLRFNKASSDYLTRTPSGTGNRRTWTFSAWVKRSKIHSVGDQIFQQSHSEGNYMKVYFYANKIYWRGQTSEANSAYIVTNRLFRDVGAWMHIVARFDSTNSTAGDRMRLYINGVEETSFSTDINPSLNYDSFANTTNAIDVGRDNVNATSYFDGYMAEVCMVDGQSLGPTSFGEFDEDSPTIWKPKDVSGLTFGTNGFYLDFEDSSSLGNDAAGSNNFTVNNLTATDQSTDTCTNNALVLNPLSANASYVFSEGNLAVAINGVNNEKKAIPSTFGSSSGKWYWEVKNTSSSNQNYIYAGFVDADVIGQFITGSQSNAPYDANNGYGNFIQGSGTASAGIGIYKAGNSNYNTSTTYLTNQIGMFALDLDNRKAWFGVNGTWINDASGNTGNPATGANSTWDSDDLISTDKVWMPATAGYYSGPSCSYNFGSPPYAISSGNTDDNGYGNFEYDVPAGFYSWNTKNLAEFG